MLLFLIRTVSCTFYLPLSRRLWIVLCRWPNICSQWNSFKRSHDRRCRWTQLPVGVFHSFALHSFTFRIARMSKARMASHQINEHITRTCAFADGHVFFHRISVYDALSAHCQVSTTGPMSNIFDDNKIHSTFSKVNLSPADTHSQFNGTDWKETKKNPK